MDKLTTELGLTPFQEEMFLPGHNACPGCGSTTAARTVLNTIGKNTIFFVPASCGSLYFGPNDTVSSGIPVIHTVFPAAFAQAEGMAYGLRRQGRSEEVVIWAGDGACYDIGLGGLSGIAARGADVLVFCNDNEGYQNTGGHESTATPPDAATRMGRRPEDLQADAWRVVEPHLLKTRREAASRFEEYADTARASNDPGEVVPAACQGRVEQLFAAVGRQQWGSFNSETQKVSISSERQLGDQDLLDLAAIQAFLHGGAVYAVDPSEVPGGGTLAAVFRY